MTSDRTTKITLGGVEYEMLLTTAATKVIGAKYGGLAKMGDKLMKSQNFEEAIDELMWLVTLLCNQTILIHNLQHPNDHKEPVKEEELELLTTPSDLAGMKDAIMECLIKGTGRNIESEPEKNAPAGKAS